LIAGDFRGVAIRMADCLHRNFSYPLLAIGPTSWFIRCPNILRGTLTGASLFVAWCKFVYKPRVQVAITERQLTIHSEMPVTFDTNSIFNSPEDDHNHNVDPELVDLAVTNTVRTHDNGMLTEKVSHRVMRVSKTMIRSLIARQPSAPDCKTRLPTLQSMSMSTSLRLRMPGRMSTATAQNITDHSVTIANIMIQDNWLNMQYSGF
jgi:hypothetical protein